MALERRTTVRIVYTQLKLFSGVFCAFACAANAQDSVVTVGFNDNNVYRVNLDGSYSTIATIPSSPMLSGVAIINQNSVAITGFQTDTVYRVNLNGTYSTIATLPNTPGLDDICALNQNSFITVGFNDNHVYRVNLDGTYSVIATIPGNPGLEGVAVLDQNSVVTIGYYDNTVYRVTLGGAISTIATIPGAPGLGGIAAINQNKYIAVGYDDHTAYLVNSDGTFSTIATLADDPGLSAVTLLDSSNMVMEGFQNNTVYRVNLDGTYSAIATLLSNPGLNGLALLPRPVSILGLTGNNLILANYFNEYGPLSTLSYFADLADPGHALKSAAPTRNALTTYASQTSQLMLSQQLYNHLDQHRKINLSIAKPIASWKNPERLLVDASDQIAEPRETAESSQPAHCTPWLSLLGDYSRGSAQDQTPAFHAGTGGFIAAFDYTGFSRAPVLGTGIAYARTEVHQTEGMGHAHVDQGSLVIYTTLIASNWSFDLAAWGGYYHTYNVRSISFPGFDGEAHSHIHGWQLAPHLEIGYTTPPSWSNWFAVEPFAMIDWVNCWEHSYRESGTGVFDFAQKGKWCSLLRSEAGLRLAESLLYSWGTLMIREKGSYACQKSFQTGAITSALVGSPGSLNLTSLTTAQNMGVGALEFLFTPRNTKYPHGSIAYQGEFCSKYQSHQAIATIAKDF